ncbi:MAG: TIGR03545 family protein [Ketobacter sp.]|nr:TIGR03545 family protein [Ketobacter sp.]
MKTIKRLFLFLLVIIFAAGVALWVLPSPLIKWAIENLGSEAVGAKVEVDSVSFSWFPTSIRLNDLAITNPSEPMTNAVEFHAIATELNLMEAIGGKIYLEEVLVEGIALDTAREHSGALPNRVEPPQQDSSFTMPDLGLPDPSALVEKEKALYQSKIDAFNTEIDARQARWESVLQQLPSEDKLAQYEADWQRAKKANALEKLSQANKISKALQQDIDKLKAGEKQLKQEYAQLQQDYKNLAGLSGKSIDQIINELGLSDSVIANLGNQLLSGKVQQWLQTGKGYYELLLGGSSDSVDASQQSVAEIQTSPDFLVKLIRLSGPFEHAGRSGIINGDIKNLSDAPALWSQPVSIDVNAVGDALGTIKLQGLLAHQKGGSEQDSLSLSVRDSRLQQVALSQSDSLGLLVNKARLNLEASASIQSLSQLDLKLDGVFSDLDMALNQGGDQNSGQADWQKTLAANLSSLQKLTLAGTAKGPLQNPDLKVSTNLNGILKNALSAELKQRSNALRQQVQGQLDQALQQQMQPLQARLGDLGGLSGEADERQKEFESMLKKLR